MRLSKLAVLASVLLVPAACSPSAKPPTAAPVADASDVNMDASVDSGTTAVVDAGSAPDAPDAGDAAPKPSGVGAAGGEVVSSDGAAGITVPPGALTSDQPILITATGIADKNLASGAYDFTPNGLSFSNDAEICLGVDAGVDTSNACLGYLETNASPPTWVCEDSCLAKKGGGGLVGKIKGLCGSTRHFTNFAILLTGGSGASDECSDGWLSAAAGGTVPSKDGLAELTVAAGVLPESKRFTITKVQNPTGDLASQAYEFAPDGTTFAKKEVDICITPTPGKDLATACLGYLDAANKKWACADTCLVSKNGKMCGSTTHFTNFAVLLTGGNGTNCKN